MRGFATYWPTMCKPSATSPITRSLQSMVTPSSPMPRATHPRHAEHSNSTNTVVNTGGALPLGADAVAMIEDTLKGDGDLYVHRALTLGSNVRSVGEDVAKGDVIAYEKDQVMPSLCALFVACGVRRIKVRRRPKSIYIPTGDEIVSPEDLAPGQELPPGKVVDSNSALLRGLFDGWVCHLISTRFCPTIRKS